MFDFKGAAMLRGALEAMLSRGRLVDLRPLLRRDESHGAIPRRSLMEVRFLVVHHSGVAVDSEASAINDYHIDKNGWPGIGYHFLVHWDGRAEYVADIEEVRYNVWGRNREVIGLCLVGDWRWEMPPREALEATRELLASLLYELGREVPVVGHREVALPQAPTACPGDTWPQWKPLVTPSPRYHLVQPGETLFAIARRYGSTVEELARINGLADPNLIRAGSRLLLGWPDEERGRYIVQPGDTLWAIARRHGTTVEELLRLNPHIQDPNLIHPGDELTLP